MKLSNFSFENQQTLNLQEVLVWLYSLLVFWFSYSRHWVFPRPLNPAALVLVAFSRLFTKSPTFFAILVVNLEPIVWIYYAFGRWTICYLKRNILRYQSCQLEIQFFLAILWLMFRDWFLINFSVKNFSGLVNNIPFDIWSRPCKKI